MSFGGGSSAVAHNKQALRLMHQEPALNQIISEAGTLYNQGVAASGYVAPTQQTLTGLAQQEAMANAANQQLADTLSGKYLNPFLSPLLQKQRQILQQMLINNLPEPVEHRFANVPTTNCHKLPKQLYL